MQSNHVDNLVGLYRSTTGVADPSTCGEDLEVNLQLVSEIAPALCTDCGGYHLRYAVSRVSQAMTPINFDRMELAQLVRAKVQAFEPGYPIDVTIAGAADTGILATCAYAAAGLDDVARRIRYMVLDICETPLVLCRGYGNWHGLDVRTALSDLRQPSVRHKSDIIILHSVFRQIPSEFHVRILEELGTWLKPGGCIIFSNRLHEPIRVTKERRLEMLAERVGRGDIKLPVPLEQLAQIFDERLSQPHEFESLDEIKVLFDRSGMVLESQLVIEKVMQDRVLPEMRVIAVLKR